MRQAWLRLGGVYTRAEKYASAEEALKKSQVSRFLRRQPLLMEDMNLRSSRPTRPFSP
jgi:hypothetical protein